MPGGTPVPPTSGGSGGGYGSPPPGRPGGPGGPGPGQRPPRPPYGRRGRTYGFAGGPGYPRPRSRSTGLWAVAALTLAAHLLLLLLSAMIALAVTDYYSSFTGGDRIVFGYCVVATIVLLIVIAVAHKTPAIPAGVLVAAVAMGIGFMFAFPDRAPAGWTGWLVFLIGAAAVLLAALVQAKPVSVAATIIALVTALAGFLTGLAGTLPLISILGRPWLLLAFVADARYWMPCAWLVAGAFIAWFRRS
jgi:hypothetical protein